MKKIITWKGNEETKEANWMGIQLGVIKNEKGLFNANVFCLGHRLEKTNDMKSMKDAIKKCETEMLDIFINQYCE